MSYRTKYYISFAALILSCGWVLASVQLIIGAGMSGQVPDRLPFLITILSIGFIGVGISWPVWTYYRARKDDSQGAQIEMDVYAQLGQQNLDEQERQNQKRS